MATKLHWHEAERNLRWVSTETGRAPRYVITQDENKHFTASLEDGTVLKPGIYSLGGAQTQAELHATKEDAKRAAAG